jgi:hypothetical protein
MPINMPRFLPVEKSKTKTMTSGRTPAHPAPAIALPTMKTGHDRANPAITLPTATNAAMGARRLRGGKMVASLPRKGARADTGMKKTVDSHSGLTLSGRARLLAMGPWMMEEPEKFAAVIGQRWP